MKLLTELLAISEDWGSSDWRPVMDQMDRLIDDHFDGKRTKINVQAAAEDVSSRWYEDMGYETAEDAVDRIVQIYLTRRKDTIVEAKGSWKIKNLAGETKSFKDKESPEARAWATSHGVERKKQDRVVSRAPKIDLQAVYNKVIEVIGNVFPDGDPIDHLIKPLTRMGIKDYDVGSTIDAAMKKHGRGSEKKGMYAYMADMWDDMAADALHDAKNSGEARSPFVEIEDGKPVKQRNPWK